MKKEISERLYLKIKASKMNLVDIANQIGVTQSIISQYYHNGKLPSLETFARLCKVIGASADEILGLK